MQRSHVMVWSTLALMLGSAILIYLLSSAPPRSPDGALDVPVLLLFFLGLAAAMAGAGSLLALVIHRRWPVLGGAATNRRADPGAAVRQGLLFAAAVLVLALLALWRQLDITFVVATVVMLGLVEAFIQSRYS